MLWQARMHQRAVVAAMALVATSNVGGVAGLSSVHLPPGIAFQRRPGLGTAALVGAGGVREGAMQRLRGGGSDGPPVSMPVSSIPGPGFGDQDMSDEAANWLAGLQSPAALVAGGAIASLFEIAMTNPPRPHDDLSVTLAKKLSVILLAMSFTAEIIVVFVSQVTATQLLGKGEGLPVNFRNGRKFSPLANSPTALLYREMEFEYLLVPSPRPKPQTPNPTP